MNLYHYCSNAAFLSILSTQEVWSSEFSLSNDLLEGKWIREIFSQCCDDKRVTPYDKSALLERFDSLIAISGAAGFCMSEEGDLLSQWRAYADNAAGVSIGFSKEYFEMLGDIKRDRNDAFNASIQKVEYNVTEQKKLISEHAERIFALVSEGALRIPTLAHGPETEEEKEKRVARFRAIIMRFTIFIFYLYRLKNPAFAEEREWRLISHLFHTSKDDEPSPYSKMDFRALSDRVLPFTRIRLEPLSLPAITEVVLGPRNVTPQAIVEAALAKHGYSHVSVRRSSASYR